MAPSDPLADGSASPSAGNAPVGVVLPAGGSGTRMAEDGQPSKQFRHLGDAPVLVQTARAFAGHRAIGPIVVVAPAGREADVDTLLRSFGVDAHVATGGATRQASVSAGVRALPSATTVVLVHDAVRPFVMPDVIDRVVGAATTHGAAAAALRVSDTLRQGGDGPLFGTTVSRDGLWAMQTPQGARRHWLLRAEANAAGHVATDEVGLLQHAGYPVRIVEGDARNLKLTRPSDWTLAEALWRAWSRSEGDA
ncbi:MAG: 2-C-methyl-D-erythritol 4-phosphate cytidylyltransferase [Bacteroidota bacterium]